MYTRDEIQALIFLLNFKFIQYGTGADQKISARLPLSLTIPVFRTVVHMYSWLVPACDRSNLRGLLPSRGIRRKSTSPCPEPVLSP